MTIHRLLQYNPGKGEFGRNGANPLRVHGAVVDEASMCDLWLMDHFLKAIPSQAALVVVGDVDQLPSVGPGLVLKDMIDSGLIPTVRLTEILRQSGGSMITINAHRVNAGSMPYHKPDAWLRQDYYHFEVKEPNDVLEKIVEICKTRIPEKFGFDPLTDVQVLTPVIKGSIGVISLNERLQATLNPVGPTLTKGERMYRLGDRVVQLANNYDKEVFNGDTGTIVAVDEVHGEILVDFDGSTVSYDFLDIDQLAPAWAITVHRSQGSEYPAVVLPVHTAHYALLQRNLLYTAITRAKRLVVTVGMTEALRIAVRNNAPVRRHSLLKERLRHLVNSA
jgi:exodeoxyribonuclease V alpha subunit